MRKLFFILIFSIVLVSFLANPAPKSIQLADAFLIFIPSLIGLICLSNNQVTILAKPQYNLMIALILYLSYLILSALIGLLHGVPLLQVLRSIGPYLNFFPLLLIGFLPSRLVSIKTIGLDHVGLAVQLFNARLQYDDPIGDLLNL